MLFIRDLPPVSTVDLRLDQPSIYFGELSNSYVLVRTKQAEFHYPRGDDNETTFYEGTGGVPIGGLLRRLLFAIRFANTDILVDEPVAAGEPHPVPPADRRSRAAARAVSDVRLAIHIRS